jgi:hypothetical protein
MGYALRSIERYTVELEEVVIAGLGCQLLGVQDSFFEGRHD